MSTTLSERLAADMRAAADADPAFAALLRAEATLIESRTTGTVAA